MGWHAYCLVLYTLSPNFSDVLGALIKLECFDILETIRPKAERYIEHYKMGSKFDPSAAPANNKLVTFNTVVYKKGFRVLNNRSICFSVNEKFFSVLKTLVNVLGSGDPCDELQRFKHGIKQIRYGEGFVPSHPVTQTVQHVGLLQGHNTDKPCLSAPVAFSQDKVSAYRYYN